MTSEEIKTFQGEVLRADPNTIRDRELRIIYWEIAYQLAIMNERQDVPKLKDNPFGVAHGEPSKRDAVPSDRGFEDVKNPDPWLELFFAAQYVFIHRGHIDFARLRAAVKTLSESFPSRTPEPAGQDSNQTHAEGYESWLDRVHAEALMKKTDREQNG